MSEQRLNAAEGASALEAVREAAYQLDSEPEHAFHVHELSMMLFEATQPIHHLKNKEAILLEAAAWLHDTGYRVDAERHHKCSRDIILGLNLPGFSSTDIAVIACVARYHRKGHPRPDHKVYRDLGRKRQELVRKLAAILRIADGLDRTHLGASRRLSTKQEDGVLLISVEQEPASPADLWGGLRKRALFEEVFGLRVEINGARVLPDVEQDPVSPVKQTHREQR